MSLTYFCFTSPSRSKVEGLSPQGSWKAHPQVNINTRSRGTRSQGGFPSSPAARRKGIHTGFITIEPKQINENGTHVCANNAVATIVLAKPRGIFIPNLGFLFVQLAQCVPFLTLIEIGYELCGSYTLLPDKSTFAQCAPATNRNHLAKGIKALRGMRGRKIATKALQFVADSSASPMETKLTMFLCLKRTMGGYGLPFPKLNYPIEPTSSARKAAHKQRYVLDLYWPKRKIDVEYDSDNYHASSEGITSDAQRRNALQLMGVTVITVTRGQLYSAASFDRTARTIAASIGVRLPKTSQCWICQKQTLRYALLKNETKNERKGKST